MFCLTERRKKHQINKQHENNFLYFLPLSAFATVAAASAAVANNKVFNEKLLHHYNSEQWKQSKSIMI